MISISGMSRSEGDHVRRAEIADRALGEYPERFGDGIPDCVMCDAGAQTRREGNLLCLLCAEVWDELVEESR